MASSSRTTSHDQPARIFGAILGMLVFLAGIALVGSVFQMARGLFDSPPPVIPAAAFPAPTPSPSPTAAPGAKVASATTGAKTKGAADASAASAANASAAPAATVIIGQALSLFIEKLLVLLIMCIAGSVIASQGIHLFFKALAAPRSIHIDPPPAP